MTQSGGTARVNSRLLVTGLALLTSLVSGAWWLTASADRAGVRREFTIYNALPAECLVHVSFAGLKSGEKCRETALARIWNDPQTQEFLKPAMDMAQAMITQTAEEMQGQIGLGKDEVMDALWNGFTVSVVNFAMSEQGEPDVDAVFTLDLSRNKDLSMKLSDLLEKTLSEGAGMATAQVDIGGFPGREVDLGGMKAYWAPAGAYIVGGTKVTTLAGICGRIKAQSTQGGLMENREFTRAWSKCAPKGHNMLFGYLDIAGAMAVADQAGMLQDPMIGTIIEFLGLDAYGAMAYGFHQEGQGFMDRVWVSTPNGPKGLMAGVQHNNNGLRTVSLAPRDAWVYSGSSTPFSSIVSGMLDNVSKFDEDTAAMVNEQIAGMEQELGFSLRNDVLASLGREFAFWMGGSPFGGMIPEIMVAVEVTDGAKIQECIDKAIVGSDSGDMFGGFTFQNHKIGFWNSGKMVNAPGQPGFGMRPCWMIHDGFLYVTLAPQIMKNFVIATKNARPAMNSNSDFSNLLAQIRSTDSEAGKDSCTYVNLGGFVTMAIDTGVPILQSIQMPAEVPVDFASFPTSDVFQRNLFGLMASSTISKDGAETAMYSPFGYLPTFGLIGGAIGGVVAVREMRSSAAADEFPMPAEDTPVDNDHGDDDKDK